LRALEDDRRGEPRLTREEWESIMRGVDGGILTAGPSSNLGHEVAKKSPHLEYARAALIERLDDWKTASAGPSPNLRPVDE
jgi:hypothetical protein